MSVIGSIDAVVDSFSLEAYNGLSIRKQIVRNILRRLNNAAAVVSKIDDQLFHSLGGQIIHSALKLFGAYLLKGRK